MPVHNEDLAAAFDEMADLPALKAENPFRINAWSKIHAAFERHADLDADKATVTVQGDIVPLSGEVHSWHEREDAENAAWAAPGIRRVKNDLSLWL